MRSCVCKILYYIEWVCHFTQSLDSLIQGLFAMKENYMSVSINTYKRLLYTDCLKISDPRNYIECIRNILFNYGILIY